MVYIRCINSMYMMCINRDTTGYTTKNINNNINSGINRGINKYVFMVY
jgi:hypothetical protein